MCFLLVLSASPNFCSLAVGFRTQLTTNVDIHRNTLVSLVAKRRKMSLRLSHSDLG